MPEVNKLTKNGKKRPFPLPSLSMPTVRHFIKRQAWHDLRLLLVISHSLVAGQLYSMLPVACRHVGEGQKEKFNRR